MTGSYHLRVGEEPHHDRHDPALVGHLAGYEPDSEPKNRSAPVDKAYLQALGSETQDRQDHHAESARGGQLRVMSQPTQC